MGLDHFPPVDIVTWVSSPTTSSICPLSDVPREAEAYMGHGRSPCHSQVCRRSTRVRKNHVYKDLNERKPKCHPNNTIIYVKTRTLGS